MYSLEVLSLENADHHSSGVSTRVSSLFSVVCLYSGAYSHVPQQVAKTRRDLRHIKEGEIVLIVVSVVFDSRAASMLTFASLHNCLLLDGIS